MTDDLPQPRRYTLRLLGSPLLTDAEGRPVPGLGAGKPLAMLAYLAVRREARRDELIALLWGDVVESKARNAFRQALHRLRTALGEDLVPFDRDRVLLADSADFWVDRSAFLERLEAGEPRSAVQVYSGDFLQGLELGESGFDLWVDGERTQLRSRFQAAVREAVQQALDAGAAQEAQVLARRAAESEPFDENAALLHARVLVGQGRTIEALGGLRQFAARLNDELGLPLPVAVREMLSRLERAASPSSPMAAAASPRATSRPPRPFIGRDSELSRLMAAAADLFEERGSALLIEGEPGCGKSRLVDEFLTRIRTLGAPLILRGRELNAAPVPYAGLAEAMRGLIRAPGVAGTSQHLLSEAARILPELRDVFSLPEPGALYDDPARLRFFEGVAALIESVAYEQPICLIIDDVQNASAATFEMLAYLAGRLQSSPVLLLLLYRPAAAVSSFANRLLGSPSDGGAAGGSPEHLTRVPVMPLDESAARELIDALLPSGASSGRVDVERIVSLGGGNPARIIELTMAALRGEPVQSAPQRLRDILWSRLLACSPSQRRVFFAAALLQRAAPLRLLAAAAHLPEPATLDAAAALRDNDLLEEVGSSYAIAHEETASFVVESSGAAGRALLAGWAAEALEHESQHDAMIRGPGAIPHAELAHLYALAGRAAEAFTHARMGALQALRTGSTVDAQRLLGLALTFAADDRSRADIERMLGGLGAGRPLLAAPVAEATAGDDSAAAAANEDAPEWDVPGETAEPASRAPEPFASPAPPSRGWRRHLRVRAGIAAAGLIAVVGSIAIRTTGLMAAFGRGGRTITDSILVAERGHERDRIVELVTGTLDDETSRLTRTTRRVTGPAWVDSVQVPWINPSTSPDGRWVALERVAPTGTDLYAISADRRDTIALARGSGDNVALGWSPDGQRLLAAQPRRLPDGSFDSDLIAYSVIVGVPARVIDSSRARAIVEAAWSPTGQSVAWVARVAPTGQQDVFVARADGAQLRNVSANPAEDFHVAWSADGTLIGFTSTRGSGAANLFATEIASGRAWQLTNDDAHNDRAMFSPDGRYVAFESTRGDDAGVYVMPTLGGTRTRVSTPGRRLGLLGWRGARPRFIETLRIVGPSSLPIGQTSEFGWIAIDNTGNALPPTTAEWKTIGDSAVRIQRDSTSITPSLRVTAEKTGLTRLIVAVPGWRADTLVVRVGDAAYALLEDSFEAPPDSARWLRLGTPAPAVQRFRGNGALFPRGDLEWESGLLSRAAFDVRENLSVQTVLYAPFLAQPRAGMSLHVALVSPVDPAGLNRDAPQFTELISINWNSESRRVTYTVDRESWSEPAAALGAGDAHRLRLTVERGGRVAFYADERLRWRSSLTVPLGTSALKAQLWLGGRATADAAAFGDLRVTLDGATP